jgi:hypothetical protein
MAENGLDLRTWLTVIGVFALFFGFPAAAVAFDLRKKRRHEAQQCTATDPLPASAPASHPDTATADLRADR